jgi:hypothetical protein
VLQIRIILIQLRIRPWLLSPVIYCAKCKNLYILMRLRPKQEKGCGSLRHWQHCQIAFIKQVANPLQSIYFFFQSPTKTFKYWIWKSMTFWCKHFDLITRWYNFFTLCLAWCSSAVNDSSTLPVINKNTLVYDARFFQRSSVTINNKALTDLN